MARTNNLTNFLTDVASAIKTKTGDSTLIPASQFDTKIADITTGHLDNTEYNTAIDDLDDILEGSTPEIIENYAQLKEKTNALMQEFTEWVYSIPNSYNASTSNPVTLYTPNINCKYYTIQKNNNNKYIAIWTSVAKAIQRKTTYTNIGEINFSLAYAFNKTAPIFSTFHGYYDSSGLTTSYYSQECDSPETCVQKMQNNELTYTSSTQRFTGPSITPIFPYTNTPYYNGTDDSFLTDLTKISSNEIFVEIS